MGGAVRKVKKKKAAKLKDLTPKILVVGVFPHSCLFLFDPTAPVTASDQCDLVLHVSHLRYTAIPLLLLLPPSSSLL
jgi:hypothetical protein